MNGKEIEDYPQQGLLVLNFDYGKVDSSVRDFVERAAVEIKLLERRAAHDMVNIGEFLIHVKEILPHGQFKEWMRIEFDYSLSAGRNFMNVARRFKGESAKFALLGPSTIQLLAAPSVPDEAIEEAIEIAQEQGSVLRVEQAKAITERYRLEAAANAEWTESQVMRRAQVEEGRTVIANMEVDIALIAWATMAGRYERIDRATIWGNPFEVDEDGTRDECILKFEDYYFMKSSLWPKLASLRGKVLGCWCYPEDCHGQVLINFLNFDSDNPFGALGFGFPIGTPDDFERFRQVKNELWGGIRETADERRPDEQRNVTTYIAYSPVAEIESITIQPGKQLMLDIKPCDELGIELDEGDTYIEICKSGYWYHLGVRVPPGYWITWQEGDGYDSHD